MLIQALSPGNDTNRYRAESRCREAAPEKRPYVHANFAIDDSGGFSGEISCSSDWRRVHQLRERYTAVGVGARTWLADRPLLTVREERLGRRPNRQPARVVFAGGHSLEVVADDRVTYVIGTPPAGATAAAPEVVALEYRGHDLRRPLAALSRQGVRSILIEGGPTLLRSFLEQGFVDRFTLFVRTDDVALAKRLAARSFGEESSWSAQRLGAGLMLELESTGKAVPPPEESP